MYLIVKPKTIVKNYLQSLTRQCRKHFFLICTNETKFYHFGALYYSHKANSMTSFLISSRSIAHAMTIHYKHRVPGHVPCPICQRTFFSQRDLRQHKLETHSY